MKHPKTTYSALVVAIARVASTAWPQHKALFDAIGELATVALGYFAADRS